MVEMGAPRPLRAYQLKMNSDRTWEEVARLTGYSGARGARLAAKRYAGKAGLPWPAPGARPRGQRRTMARPQRAYQLRARGGMTWREIAIEVGYSPAHQGRTALMMARYYAGYAGRPWPIGCRTPP